MVNDLTGVPCFDDTDDLVDGNNERKLETKR
jgi:hypothetical protein